MTKIQNLCFNKKIKFLVFLFLMMNVQIFAQSIGFEQQISMLALGDSYTIGESVELYDRWPHQLMAELRKRGVDVMEPDYIATTGWTTSDLLEGIARGLDRDKEYNLVSILIGVNNQYQALDINIYEPELRKIIDLALEITGDISSSVFILSIPDYAYTPFGKGKINISREIDAYNEIKERVAREYDLAFFNITPISRRGLSEPDLVASDGLHPSGKQYRAWVDELYSHASLFTQDDSADFEQIKRIFYQQEVDWNKGDIDAFMKAYWKSDELQFGGANGITKGWDETLERYKTGYPDRASMGQLSFQIKDMTRHSESVVSLTGSWQLTRENDQPGGHFLLIWRKIEGEWKIVVDHTSQKFPQ
jgi:lysophospholipase L1-like esterase/ketosteroid isomerase-like protein